MFSPRLLNATALRHKDTTAQTKKASAMLVEIIIKVSVWARDSPIQTKVYPGGELRGDLDDG